MPQPINKCPLCQTELILKGDNWAWCDSCCAEITPAKKTNMKTSDFKKGDQIIYIPDHAENKFHRDCQLGFVTSINEQFVFCRYFNKNSIELRTRANSEATYPRNLEHRKYCSQDYIDNLIKSFN